MISPAWVMPPLGQLPDLGGNVWSRLKELSVEPNKVPAAAFSQGWLALDDSTLIPVNGSGSGSLFHSQEGILGFLRDTCSVRLIWLITCLCYQVWIGILTPMLLLIYAK